jgi:hypothetical protein
LYNSEEDSNTIEAGSHSAMRKKGNASGSQAGEDRDNASRQEEEADEEDERTPKVKKKAKAKH